MLAEIMAEQTKIQDRIAKQFKQGHVVLFVGPECCKSSGLPDNKQLLEKIQQEFEKRDMLTKHDRNQIAAWFENVENYPRVAKLFKDKSSDFYHLAMVNVFDPHPDEKRLVPPTYFSFFNNLHLTQIITTNFDTLIERSLPTELWRSCTWKDPESLAYYFKANRPLIFHLYGRIGYSGTLVHTLDEYKSFHGQEGDAARSILQELFKLNTVLFIGYKLDDPVLSWIKELTHNKWNFKPEYYISTTDNGLDKMVCRLALLKY